MSLIDYLVLQVALGGSQGTSESALGDFARVYYEKHTTAWSEDSSSKAAVDDALVKLLWRQLLASDRLRLLEHSTNEPDKPRQDQLVATENSLWESLCPCIARTEAAGGINDDAFHVLLIIAAARDKGCTLKDIIASQGDTSHRALGLLKHHGLIRETTVRHDDGAKVNVFSHFSIRLSEERAAPEPPPGQQMALIAARTRYNALPNHAYEPSTTYADRIKADIIDYLCNCTSHIATIKDVFINVLESRELIKSKVRRQLLKTLHELRHSGQITIRRDGRVPNAEHMVSLTEASRSQVPALTSTATVPRQILRKASAAPAGLPDPAELSRSLAGLDEAFIARQIKAYGFEQAYPDSSRGLRSVQLRSTHADGYLNGQQGSRSPTIGMLVDGSDVSDNGRTARFAALLDDRSMRDSASATPVDLDEPEKPKRRRKRRTDASLDDTPQPPRKRRARTAVYAADEIPVRLTRKRTAGFSAPSLRIASYFDDRVAGQELRLPPSLAISQSAFNPEDDDEDEDEDRPWTMSEDDLLCCLYVVIAAELHRGDTIDWSGVEYIFQRPIRSAAEIDNRFKELRQEPDRKRFMSNLRKVWSASPYREHAAMLKYDGRIAALESYVDLAEIWCMDRAIMATASAAESIYDRLERQGKLTVPPEYQNRAEQTWDFFSKESAMVYKLNDAAARCSSFGSFGPIVEHAHPDITATVSLATAQFKMLLSQNDSGDIGKDYEKLVKKISNHKQAIAELQTRAIIAKTRSIEAQWRAPKLTEKYMSAFGGPMSTLHSAEAQARLQGPAEISPWPILASDHDMAALVSKIANNEASLEVNTQVTIETRDQHDQGLRKFDDDEYENEVNVRFVQGDNLDTATLPVEEEEAGFPHVPEDLLPSEDHSSSCVVYTGNQVQPYLVYDATLEQERLELAKTTAASRSEQLAQLKLDLVRAGPDGLALRLCNTDEATFANTKLLLSTQPPLAFVEGAREPRLVSCKYLREWSLALSKDRSHTSARYFPRTWLNVDGTVNQSKLNKWKLVVRSSIFNLPLASEAALRTNLPSMTGQELRDVLGMLLEAGQVRCRSGNMYLSGLDRLLPVHWEIV
ncbi:uncharacterized protein L969DRAFT_88883 [Mixia osmundae IAM 14324]|uniref:Transcription factor tau subunit sfc3/Tfc3 C-terminal domain-containing protein n=1 Tax=Mixia osmundae (strain CBS 9802 / IAM 14324 / JCM 22182 / KY 12970) TaxID=764103 RepID=G7E7N7_MIXOS|nr:uncharacterized protein L969DRAFT_88883 [Mixia osmundae IAM 14324]KEI38447.1 hypothetical protein L969DRAFT_88883 [Mixia osmundae IAM 14324]GAA98847.1 hypothetical protein E5Q_05535 [Mixia osmundae IAM 14324]